MKKNVYVIYNPRAGRDRTRHSIGALRDALSALPYTLTFLETRHTGHATQLVKEKCTDADLILCCGGDGTFNETANGVMQAGLRVPIGYFPMGSTNDFAASLGIPKDIPGVVELLRDGHTNFCDLGKFNDRYFTYIASFGPGTAISYSTPQRLKNLLGYKAYMLNTFLFRLIPTLRELKPVRVRVERDGVVTERDVFFCAVSNALSAAGGVLRYDPNLVRFNDGKFEISFFHRLRSAGDLLGIARHLRARDYSGKQMSSWQGDRLHISFDRPQAWTLDGEFGGKVTELDITICPRALEVISPPSPLLEQPSADVPAFATV